MMKKNILLCLLIFCCSYENYTRAMPSITQIIGITVSCVVIRYATLWIAEYVIQKAIDEENYSRLDMFRFIWNIYPFFLKKGGMVPRMLACLDNTKKNMILYLIDIGTYVKPEILLRACRNNDIQLVRQCIKGGVCASKAVYKSSGGAEPFYGYLAYANAIHHASYHGNKEVIQLLLNAEVSINQRDEHYFNALYYALQTIDGLKIVDFLLEKGIEPKSIQEKAIEYVTEKKYLVNIKSDVDLDEWTTFRDYFDYHRNGSRNLLKLLPEEHFLFWQCHSVSFKEVPNKLKDYSFAKEVKKITVKYDDSLILSRDDFEKIKQNIVTLRAAINESQFFDDQLYRLERHIKN